jgi:shikimate dehydrogenase
MPALYGLIGYPLAHSFSPAYFKKKFAEQNIDAVYEAFTVEDISGFPDLLNAYPNMQGLNVTIPHKETVIFYLDELDSTAAEIGAVNCITLKNGVKKGYNTDVTGFEQSLIPLLQSQHTHALILGTGGSSKAVAYVLKQLGIAYRFVSRKEQPGCITYPELTAEIIAQHKLIVNTTSLGLYPYIDGAPSIPYENLTTHHLLYDVIYNPEETKFLSLGKEQGAAIKNGFEMLQLQAEASWDIWSRNMQMPE